MNKQRGSTPIIVFVVGLIFIFAIGGSFLLKTPFRSNKIFTQKEVISPAPVTTSPARAADNLQPRPIPDKPAHTKINLSQFTGRIIVRFADQSGIRLRRGKLVSQNGLDTENINNILSQFEVKIERLYTRPEEELEKERFELEARSGRLVADKNLAYLLIVPTDQDNEKLVDDLNALSIVEIAYQEYPVVNP